MASPTDSEGTLLFDVKWGCDESDISAGDEVFVGVRDSWATISYFGGGGLYSYDGTNNSNVAHPAFSTGDTIAYAIRWGDVDGNANDLSAGLSDGTWVFDARAVDYDGAFALGTDLRLSYSNIYPIHIKDIKFYNIPYTQAELADGIYRRILKWMMHFELP